MKISWITILAITVLSVTHGIEVIDGDGISRSYPVGYFRNLGTEQVLTTRHRDSGPKTESWQGMRLDNWLKDNGFIRWQNIRLESEDNYVVNIHRAEFDTLECWMVFRQGEVELDSLNYRVIFPALRDLYWVRAVQRIVLEDFNPMFPPQRLMFWEKESVKLSIHNDPDPFIKTRAYMLDDVMQLIFRTSAAQVILVSSDGLRLRMEYPRHLGNAVLEIGEQGSINLKSARIPGGLWMKDIIYLQAENLALIMPQGIERLVEISRLLDWNLSPGSLFYHVKRQQLRQTGIDHVILNAKELLEADWLEIEP
ncbi:MAG: hypothetical protein FJ042_01605 [Candidatus Cloacimonetes bacterium]|nr:hypothetical protein [Candidatus Cloacimonadota bacterium]